MCAWRSNFCGTTPGLPTLALKFLGLFAAFFCLESFSSICHKVHGVFGALYTRRATVFRLYAPHAESVSVVGEFNDWKPTPMFKEGNYFKISVATAKPGHRYKFQVTHDGKTFLKADPRAMQVDAKGNSVIADHWKYEWKTTDYQRPPHNKVVLYELHVSSFAGNWKAAAEKLQHLKETGVNMIVVMPPAETAFNDMLGYSTSFPYAPKNELGAPDDIKHFIDTAHGMRLGVVIDVVHNHWNGSNFENFDGPSFGSKGLYYYDDWRAHTPWGNRPNYGRQEVKDYIRDNARMWLHLYKADGLRWDSTEHIRLGWQNGPVPIPDGEALLREVNDMVAAEYPGALMIAEDLKNQPFVDLPTAYGGLGFSGQMSQEAHYPLRDVITKQNDGDRNMESVQYAVTNSISYVPLRQVLFMENHDVVHGPDRRRIPSDVSPENPNGEQAKKLSVLASGIVLTSAGIPWLFQGQEFHSVGDWNYKAPLDWSQLEQNRDTWNQYRRLIELRKNSSGQTAGLTGTWTNFFHRNDNDKVVAYHRWDQGGPGDDVIVVANFSGRDFPAYDIGLPRGGAWQVRYGLSATVETKAERGDSLDFRGTVALPPYSLLILSQ